jgi:hypothetical protein
MRKVLICKNLIVRRLVEIHDKFYKFQGFTKSLSSASSVRGDWLFFATVECYSFSSLQPGPTTSFAPAR